MRSVDFARLLLKSLGNKLPVDLEQLARNLVIDVELADLGAVDGSLQCSNGRNLIVLNRRRTLPRRRFTLAHEIGHLLLSPHSPLDLTPEPLIDEEHAANLFAVELLMPERAVRDLWLLYSGNPTHRLHLMAERLLVSRKALRLRLQEMGYLKV